MHGNAKEQTEIAEEKEVLDTATVKAMAKDKYGNIQKENLDNELNKSVGEDKYESKEMSEGIEITFINSNRRYLVDIDGNIEALRNPEPTPEDSTLATLSQMKYGVIEVDFLNKKGYEVTTTPNEPILKDGMKAVYWAKDESGEIDTENPANNTYEITSDDSNFKKENWYSYTAKNSTTESGGTSRWANAITSDGSYYVWIPRYSYRIIYFDTEEHENAYRAGNLTEEDALANNYIVGYSDARGIVDKDGKKPTSVSSQTGIAVNDKKFRIHPAFDNNVDEGGWSSKLTGFWVMKYDLGWNKVSKPNSYSGSADNIANVYKSAKNSNPELNSHLTKNSEWGAIVYLTYSKYGRNGTQVTLNSDVLIAGKDYDTESGMLCSSTGNIYGIYDLLGAKREWTAAYYTESTNEYISTISTITVDKKSDEFLTAYRYTDEKIYFIVGDATYETSGMRSGWCPPISLDNPFFIRATGGGPAGNIFAVASSMGRSSDSSCGYRVCLCVM